MPTVEHPSTKSLVTKVIQYAKTQIHDKDQLTVFSRFIELFYSHASENDLKHRSIAELFAMVNSQWALVCKQKKVTEDALRVFNPDIESDGWHTTHTVIELMMQDMPFIVDSMRMEMNRLGYTVQLMIHMGGMTICRDAKGHPTHVDVYDADKKQSGVIESPVYMEIDRQTDPAILEMIRESLTHVLSDVKTVVEDWQPMQDRVKASIEALSKPQSVTPKEEVKESICIFAVVARRTIYVSRCA